MRPRNVGFKSLPILDHPAAHCLSGIKTPFVSMRRFEPIIKDAAQLQIRNTKIFDGFVRWTVKCGRDLGVVGKIVESFVDDLVQDMSLFIARPRCVTDAHLEGICAAIGHRYTLLDTILRRRGQRDALEFRFRTQVFLIKSFRLPPVKHHVGFGCIGRSPNLSHCPVTVSIRSRLFPITFNGNFQVMRLLWNIARPSTWVVDNVASAVGVVVAVVFRRVAKVPDEIRSGVVFVFFGVRRRARRHTIRTGAVGGRLVLTIVFPGGGTLKNSCQLFTIFVPLHSQIREQFGVFFGRESRNVPSLRAKRAKTRWRINDFILLQFFQCFRMTGPYFGNHMRARNVGFRRIVVSGQFLDLGAILVLVGGPHGGPIVAAPVIKPRLEIVKVDIQSGPSGFDRHGDIQKFGEQNLQDPSFKKDAFPVLRRNSHLHIIHGRRAAVPIFRRFGRIFGVTRSDTMMVVLQLIGQTTATKKGVGAGAPFAHRPVAHLGFAIKNTEAGNRRLHNDNQRTAE
mmetsp:Transcript_14130/g.30796  ORF Transcript_14130/g.30796 Transcript_14130/m.30796 type:complete len:509 (-) Transcript_14130:152-1678(-)